MIDLHAHICYGIDDGARNIEESKKLLRIMAQNGFTHIFLTPHYIENSQFICDNNIKRKIFHQLERYVKEEGLNVKLYLGNEVYLTDNCVELIKNDKISTLNNSKYVLMELPMLEKNPNTRSILHNIIVNGYIPIIAHPERYEYLDKDFLFFKDLASIGVLFQGNYLSLFGKYGKRAKKNLKKMLILDMIDFLGTDIHHEEKLYGDKVFKAIKKCVRSEEKVKDLLENNAYNIIVK